MAEKMRILHVTSTPPVPTWGGSMAFYRHFCERGDFDILVITDNQDVVRHHLPYTYFVINRGRLWRRLTTTRFYKLGHTLGHFVARDLTNPEILRAIDDFNPQAVFTVAGNWSWMALLAEKIARKRRIPLIGSFNDWWFYNSIRYRFADGLLERQFKKFYQRCDLAICTSDAMKRELGPHANAVVIYPMGAEAIDTGDKLAEVSRGPFLSVFAGNLGEWYGKMLEQLLSVSAGEDLTFTIFGSNATWTDTFNDSVTRSGIYRGQVSFDKLRQEIKSADALLLLMGFDERVAQIEKTSFKTKFLDYISLQKPILLWGPEYCSAVQTAREFDCAEICASPRAEDFYRTILALRNNRERQRQLVENARRMYDERFNPNTLHHALTTSIRKAIQFHAN